MGEFRHWSLSNLCCRNHLPVCCWLRAKGQRSRKHGHRQLLSTISSAIVRGPPAAERSSKSRSSGVHPCESAKCSGTLPLPQAPLPSSRYLSSRRSVTTDRQLERGGYPAYPFPRPITTVAPCSSPLYALVLSCVKIISYISKFIILGEVYGDDVCRTSFDTALSYMSDLWICDVCTCVASAALR